MTVVLKDIASGVGETWRNLANQSPAISAGVVISAGIGGMIGGPYLAWRMAKVSGIILGAIFGLRSMPQQLTFRTVANIATALVTVPVTIFAIQSIWSGHCLRNSWYI